VGRARPELGEQAAIPQGVQASWGGLQTLLVVAELPNCIATLHLAAGQSLSCRQWR
jgi:hypothetical protein